MLDVSLRFCLRAVSSAFRYDSHFFDADELISLVIEDTIPHNII